MAKSNDPEQEGTPPAADSKTEKVEKPQTGPSVSYTSTSAPAQVHTMPKADWDKLRADGLLQHCELVAEPGK